jgi:hypothetical protein
MRDTKGPLMSAYDPKRTLVVRPHPVTRNRWHRRQRGVDYARLEARSADPARSGSDTALLSANSTRFSRETRPNTKSC